MKSTYLGYLFYGFFSIILNSLKANPEKLDENITQFYHLNNEIFSKINYQDTEYKSAVLFKKNFSTKSRLSIYRSNKKNPKIDTTVNISSGFFFKSLNFIIPKEGKYTRDHLLFSPLLGFEFGITKKYLGVRLGYERGFFSRETEYIVNYNNTSGLTGLIVQQNGSVQGICFGLHSGAITIATRLSVNFQLRGTLLKYKIVNNRNITINKYGYNTDSVLLWPDGSQRIKFSGTKFEFGAEISYKINKKINVIYSTYLGNLNKSSINIPIQNNISVEPNAFYLTLMVGCSIKIK